MMPDFSKFMDDLWPMLGQHYRAIMQQMTDMQTALANMQSSYSKLVADMVGRDLVGEVNKIKARLDKLEGK